MKQSLLERAGLEIDGKPASEPAQQAATIPGASTSWTTARARSKIPIGPFEGQIAGEPRRSRREV